MVLQDLPQNRMNGEKEESTTGMSDHGVEPESGNATEKHPTNDTAHKRHGFDRRYAKQSPCATVACAEQQGAQRQAFRDFVHADSENQREIQYAASVRLCCLGLVTGGKRKAIGRAMNGQRYHHRHGYLAEPMGCRLVEMARRARRANVVNIFRDESKDGVARTQCQQKAPPMQGLQTFRQDGAYGYAQESARSKADQGAQPTMRTTKRRAQDPTPYGEEEGQHDVSN